MAARPANRGYIPGRGRPSFSSPKCPVLWGSFSRGKATEAQSIRSKCVKLCRHSTKISAGHEAAWAPTSQETYLCLVGKSHFSVVRSKVLSLKWLTSQMQKLNRQTARSLQFRDKYTKFCGRYEDHAIAYTMAGEPMAWAPKATRGFLDA